MLSLQYHSELDSTFWRGKIPLELLYPGSWVPGIGEVGNSLINTWGGEYPRMGELVQSHPRKASAVMAHRVGSIIRRGAQPHIYKKLYAKGGGFRYFAQMADPKWQAVHPIPEPGCITFGANDSLGVGSWGDYKTSGNNGYVWNLWHRYECCSKAAEIFLFAVP
jgi:integrating conjugative element protein (TIGR03756 family)